MGEKEKAFRARLARKEVEKCEMKGVDEIPPHDFRGMLGFYTEKETQFLKNSKKLGTFNRNLDPGFEWDVPDSPHSSFR